MKPFLRIFLLLTMALPATVASAQAGADERAIIKEMNAAAAKWNQGDLDGYMSLYDPSATMMMPQGREGIKGMRSLYEKYYFENGKPKQQLAYDTYQFTPLGKNYGLLTGRFILQANEKMKERTGTFSLVMVRQGKEWKILHDHSG